MGSPAAVNALEMMRANGARRVILFGACGGIDPGLRVGQLVVVSGAVRGEGASRYYAPPEYPAAFHPELVTRLLFEARHSDTEGVHLGVVYTTDAGYRQGPEIYETYASLAVAVDSESAAVAVAAARLGLEAGALLFCTDNVTLTDPADRGYRGLRDPRVRLGFEVALEVCLRVLGSP
jgi:uridine phosphorylase